MVLAATTALHARSVLADQAKLQIACFSKPERPADVSHPSLSNCVRTWDNFSRRRNSLLAQKTRGDFLCVYCIFEEPSLKRCLLFTAKSNCSTGTTVPLPPMPDTTITCFTSLPIL